MYPFAVQRWATDGFSIKRPFGFMPLAVFMSLFGLVTGIFDAIGRMFFITMYSVLSIGMVHTSALPPSLQRHDVVFGGFCAWLQFHHLHRNPILEEAVERLAGKPRGAGFRGQGRRSRSAPEVRASMVKAAQRALGRPSGSRSTLLGSTVESGSERLPYFQVREAAALSTAGSTMVSGGGRWHPSAGSPGFTRARNRWQLGYTLLKNPAVARERRRGPHEEPPKDEGPVVWGGGTGKIRKAAGWVIYGAAEVAASFC